MCRNRRSQIFFKYLFLKIWKFDRTTHMFESHFNKASDLKSCNFIEKRPQPLKFAKFLRTPFFTEHVWWLSVNLILMWHMNMTPMWHKNSPSLFVFHYRLTIHNFNEGKKENPTLSQTILIRISRSQMFFKIGVLKNPANFKGKQRYNKVQAFRKYCEIFKNSFFYRIPLAATFV